jgi:hypothetical protein
MASFRTPEMKKKYEEHLQTGALDKACPLCDKKSIKTFKHWKIIDNKFPYDLIAKIHHMIVPIRHVVENDLNEEELEELRQIKENFFLNPQYDYIIEAATKNKSIPKHFHLHLIVAK